VKLRLKSILKILLPLSFGVLIAYLFFNKLSPENKFEIKQAFKSANYWWLVLSGFFAIFGQFFRAIRWRMLVKSLGYDITLLKSFNAISINYLVNLAIPRAGEFARCGIIAKYDNIPMQKSFGTIINERAIDLIMLGLTGLLAMIIEFDVFIGFARENIAPHFDSVFGKLRNLVVIGVIVLLLGGLIYFLYKTGRLKFIDKFKHIIEDVAHGILSIRFLEKPLQFVFFTLLNWCMYWLMIYTAFFTIPAGHELPFLSALFVLFFGTFGFIAVQGGLGVYPILVGMVLALYGVPNHMGNTIGWMMWIGQTIFIFITAIFALPFFMADNKKVKIPEKAI
jgi:glycosyltransferase 2 family protein